MMKILKTHQFVFCSSVLFILSLLVSCNLLGGNDNLSPEMRSLVLEAQAKYGSIDTTSRSSSSMTQCIPSCTFTNREIEFCTYCLFTASTSSTRTFSEVTIFQCQCSTITSCTGFCTVPTAAPGTTFGTCFCRTISYTVRTDSITTLPESTSFYTRTIKTEPPTRPCTCPSTTTAVTPPACIPCPIPPKDVVQHCPCNGSKLITRVFVNEYGITVTKTFLPTDVTGAMKPASDKLDCKKGVCRPTCDALPMKRKRAADQAEWYDSHLNSNHKLNPNVLYENGRFPYEGLYNERYMEKRLFERFSNVTATEEIISSATVEAIQATVPPKPTVKYEKYNDAVNHVKMNDYDSSGNRQVEIKGLFISGMMGIIIGIIYFLMQ